MRHLIIYIFKFLLYIISCIFGAYFIITVIRLDANIFNWPGYIIDLFRLYSILIVVICSGCIYCKLSTYYFNKFENKYIIYDINLHTNHRTISGRYYGEHKIDRLIDFVNSHTDILNRPLTIFSRIHAFIVRIIFGSAIIIFINFISFYNMYAFQNMDIILFMIRLEIAIVVLYSLYYVLFDIHRHTYEYLTTIFRFNCRRSSFIDSTFYEQIYESWFNYLIRNPKFILAIIVNDLNPRR